MAKMAFLTVNNFYWVFSKIPTKRTFVRLFFLVGFSKTKNTHFRGFKMVLFKSQISNLYFCQTKILIFGPPGIFKHENVDACAPKFWNWTSKIIPDLWLLVRSKKNSTLHPSTHSWNREVWQPCRIRTVNKLLCIWDFNKLNSNSIF